MSIESDLSGSPYFDSVDPENDYVKVLFKSGVSVQTRELQEIQSLAQTQLERFGDNIFKHGTIVDGCNFIFRNPYPFAKLLDTENDGTVTAPSRYVGMFARNSANLQAFITDYADGFEATDPDLNTIYVSYINSGNTGNIAAFTAGENLTITDANSSIFGVTVNVGGLGFSNTDPLVFVPRLVVNVTTGSFSNGEYVTQPTLGSNLQIIDIDSTTLSLAGQVILTVRPRLADLANGQVNSTAWSTINADSIHNVSNTATGTVEAVLGEQAAGGIVTDGSGKILSTVMTNRGRDYSNTPYVGVRSPNNSAGVTAMQLTARNYLANVQIANSVDAVGDGYAFAVTEGVIYQKGYLLRVAPQSVIVSKYDTVPNNVSAGFSSVEEIINSNIDPDLLDPAFGENNYQASGADRLRITPTLTVVDKDTLSETDTFFSICDWSEGNPYKYNQTTVYSRIGDEMARRTDEGHGDFVIDRFLVTTRSVTNSSYEGTRFSVVVDPGKAYIDGYRVETNRNFALDVTKGIDTLLTNNQVVGIGYGSWIKVNELGGVFQFSTGDIIDLRDTAKQFSTNTSLSLTGNVDPVGSSIGNARIRSLIYDSGIPGTNSAIYRLHLFDIRMATGKNFRDVRSFAYTTGTYPGVGDIVVEPDPSTGSNVCVLHQTGNNSLIIPLGIDTLKNSNNATYDYRTIFQTVSFANTGLLTKSIAASPDEFFTYLGPLSDDEMQDLYVVPTAGDLRAFANIAGTVSVNTTSPNAIGTATTFITDVRAGDFLYLSGNSTENVVRKVVTVVNNTHLVLDSNSSFANTGAGVYRVFPKNVPIPFGRRDGLGANVDANGNILTLDLGFALVGSATVNAAVAIDVQRRGVVPGTKVASRQQKVRLCLSNNAGSTTGPWCVGVPDVFRLRSVYVGTSNAVSNSDIDATDDFFIDHNQTPNFLDLSWLVKKPGSSLTLTTSDWLLVEFDYFTISANGFFNTVSYVSANAAQVALVDAQPLSNLTTTISSHEIPQVYTTQGYTYDLLNCLDFRPSVVNTVATTTNAAASPINPSNVTSFGNTADPANDKKFPHPQSVMTVNIEQYLGRMDAVFVAKDANIFVLKGIPAPTASGRLTPNQPSATLHLNDIKVPPYPTLPYYKSNTVQEIIDVRVGNEKLLKYRHQMRTATTVRSNFDVEAGQPAGYSMRKIGQLERRIENLEYYEALNLLESDIKNRVIPSSTDPAINRFKFGFFADDYSTAKYQQLDDPQYAATIENDDLVPEKMIWSVGSGNNQHTCKYVDWLVIDQDQATSNAGITTNTVSNTTGHVITPNCVPNTATANAYVLVQQADSTQRGTRNTTDAFDFGSAVDVRMSTVSGPVSLFFHGYSAPDRVVVYRGNTVFKTADDSVVLTPSDQTRLKARTFPQGWFSSVTFADRTQPASQHMAYSGKITWTHNPSLGRDYTVVVGKGSGSTIWRYALEFPLDASTYACPEEPSPNTATAPIEYNGVIKVTLLSGGTAANPVANFRLFTNGVKPSTTHTLQVRGMSGGSYTSDNNGTLDITWSTDQSTSIDLLSGTPAYDTNLAKNGGGTVTFYFKAPSPIKSSAYGAYTLPAAVVASIDSRGTTIGNNVSATPGISNGMGGTQYGQDTVPGYANSSAPYVWNPQ